MQRACRACTVFNMLRCVVGTPQARELERMGALETEWREREAERAAQLGVREGELTVLESKARKVRHGMNKASCPQQGVHNSIASQAFCFMHIANNDMSSVV